MFIFFRAKSSTITMQRGSCCDDIFPMHILPPATIRDYQPPVRRSVDHEARPSMSPLRRAFIILLATTIFIIILLAVVIANVYFFNNHFRMFLLLASLQVFAVLLCVLFILYYWCCYEIEDDLPQCEHEHPSRVSFSI